MEAFEPLWWQMGQDLNQGLMFHSKVMDSAWLLIQQQRAQTLLDVGWGTKRGSVDADMREAMTIDLQPLVGLG